MKPAGFEEILNKKTPQIKSRENKITIKFEYCEERGICALYIGFGQELVKDLGYKIGDRFKVYYSNLHGIELYLERSDEKDSYLRLKHCKINKDSFTINIHSEMLCHIFGSKPYKLRECHYLPFEKGLKITPKSIFESEKLEVKNV